jgi:hypothetical protein
MANRITQVPIEVPIIGSPQVRLTQLATEVVAMGSPNIKMTQCAIEVVVPNVPNTGPPGGPLNAIMEFVLP